MVGEYGPGLKLCMMPIKQQGKPYLIEPYVYKLCCFMWTM